jgi:hypothetical protein
MKRNIEQIFSIWISVAKFLPCIDIAHLATCDKSFSILFDGILVKWFITDRKDFGIDRTKPRIRIKILFVINNKVVFAHITYDARYDFSVEDVITNTSFYDACNRNFVAAQ